MILDAWPVARLVLAKRQWHLLRGEDVGIGACAAEHAAEISARIAALGSKP